MPIPTGPDQQVSTRNSAKDAEFEWLLCLASALQSGQQALDGKQSDPLRQIAGFAPRNAQATKSHAA